MKKGFVIKHLNIRGFTIIELLVVILILGIIGGILATILPRAFRANDRTLVLSNLKQNGQNALNTLTRGIRSSKTLVCLDDAGKILTLRNPEGSFLRFSFIEDSSGNNNNYITQDMPLYSALDPQTGETDDFCALDRIPLSVDSRLTDNSDTSGVNVENGQFSLKDRNTISISFTVKPSKKSQPRNFNTQNLPGETFQTTVQLR